MTRRPRASASAPETMGSRCSGGRSGSFIPRRDRRGTTVTATYLGNKGARHSRTVR